MNQSLHRIKKPLLLLLLSKPFSSLPSLSSLPPSQFSSAISDLSRSPSPSDALLLFSSLRRLHPSFSPSPSLFPSLLLSASSLPHPLPSALNLHLLALLLGHLPSSLFVSSSLLHFYSHRRLLPSARRLFLETPFPNAVLFTALISAYLLNSLPSPALSLFKSLIAQLGPSELDPAAIISALSACSRIPDIRALAGVHGVGLKLGLDLDVGVGNSLVDGYAKCGEVGVGGKVFDGMPERDVVSWNSMVAAYAQNGLAAEAVGVYKEMVVSGEVRQNAVTLSAVLLACAHAGALQVGKCVHDQVIRMGLEQNVYVGTSAVDMYCKCGRVEMARKAFDRMKERNIKTWSAMIAGYGMHGRGSEALAVFDEMRKTDVKPNYITFVSVLAACSHSGLVDEGRHWLKAMKQDYNIDPGVEHYGCVVDLLGRAGCLSEAYDLIKSMRIKPDSVVWGALLSACRIHKNVKLGEISAKKLFELDSKNCGYYVLLSNIYADAGRWRDVERMRVLIKNRGIVKPPGYSLVELKGKTHVFLVGDRRHSRHEEIYGYLGKLSVRMQEAGYVPDTGSVLHDVDQEEKEKVLQVHSEKLAVAFAIMSTVRGASILVIKNLRVCGDCHSAIKLIAKLEGREIVVRDSHRFHHFRDGVCSCGDYW